MKKINYFITPSYKISINDMSIDISFKGHIIYRKKQYKIISRKTYKGPVFNFEYFEENLNDNIKSILEYASPLILKDIQNNFKDYTNMDLQLEGEIDLKKRKKE